MKNLRIVVAVSVYGGDDWEEDRLRDWVLNGLMPHPDEEIDTGAGIRVAALATEVEVRRPVS